MSVFENKKVFIKFLYKDKSLPAKHILFGGKHNEATVTVSMPHFENKPIKIFDNDEIAELEVEAQEDLSFKKDNEFWRSGITQFALTKEGVTLDLTNWVDVIRYRIATHEIYKNLIGHGDSYSSLCKYAIFTDEGASDAAKTSDKRFDAIAFYGKYADNIQVLRYIYFAVTKQRVSLTESIDKIQSRVKEQMELELGKFIRVMKESNLEEKGLLLEAMLASVVEQTSVGFIYNGIKLYKGNQGNMESAAEFLADKLNQATKFEIQGKVKDKV